MRVIIILVFLCVTISKVEAQPIKMAITVDDLPVHSSTLPTESREKIAKRFVAAFQHQHLSGIYGFVNGHKLIDQPDSMEVLKIWTTAGNPLGNHSYTHMNLTKNSAEDFIEDVKMNEPALRPFSGTGSYKWFRYPYLHEGDTLEKRNKVRSALSALGYRIAQVTVDFEDYAWNSAYVRCVTVGNKKALGWLESSYLKQAMNRLNYSVASSKKLFGRQVNQILLLHIGVFDSLMFDKLVSTYKKAGVEFISLSEAAADPIYNEDPGVVVTYGGSFPDQFAKARGIPLPGVEELPLRKLSRICSR